MDTPAKNAGAGYLQRRLEDACWPAALRALVHWVIFYQLLDADIGLEIKIMDLFKRLLSQERSLGVSELRFQSGTASFQWNFFFCLVTKNFFNFFFLLVHLKYHLTPLPIKKVDYPCKRGQNWGSYVHNSLPRFNWEYRSCFHTWKRLVCPALCILAPS